MESRSLGVFSFPDSVNQGTASYSVPGIISKNEIKHMLVIPKKEDSLSNEDEDDDEVTHEVFFGENIKRIIKTLFNK